MAAMMMADAAAADDDAGYERKLTKVQKSVQRAVSSNGSKHKMQILQRELCAALRRCPCIVHQGVARILRKMKQIKRRTQRKNSNNEKKTHTDTYAGKTKSKCVQTK